MVGAEPIEPAGGRHAAGQAASRTGAGRSAPMIETPDHAAQLPLCQPAGLAGHRCLARLSAKPRQGGRGALRRAAGAAEPAAARRPAGLDARRKRRREPVPAAAGSRDCARRCPTSTSSSRPAPSHRRNCCASASRPVCSISSCRSTGRARWRQFVRHWRPDLSVWVESELWPNLILETAARGTPMLLLNGPRLQALSHALAPGAAPESAVACGVRLRAGANRRRRRAVPGARRAQRHRAGQPQERRAAAACGRGSRCGAEASHRQAGRAGPRQAPTRARRKPSPKRSPRLRRSVPNLLTILAPRHPERGDACVDLLEGRGLATARHSSRRRRRAGDRRLSGRYAGRARPGLSSCGDRLRRRLARAAWRAQSAGAGAARLRARDRPRTRRISRKRLRRWRMPAPSAGLPMRARLPKPCAPCSTTRARGPRARPLPMRLPARSAAGSRRRSA